MITSDIDSAPPTADQKGGHDPIFLLQIRRRDDVPLLEVIPKSKPTGKKLEKLWRAWTSKGFVIFDDRLVPASEITEISIVKTTGRCDFETVALVP